MTRIMAAGLCHQRLVHEITFATRFTTAAKNNLASHVAQFHGVDSVPIPEFAVYHDPFFDLFPNSLQFSVDCPTAPALPACKEG